MRKPSMLAALLLALRIDAALAAAPRADVQIELYAGVAAPAGRGKATPITALIRNSGPSASAVLDVFLDGKRGPRIHTGSLDLPGQSRRRLQFYGPANLSRRTVVAVIRAGLDTLAEASVPVAGVSAALLVIAGEDTPAISMPSPSGLSPSERPPLWALPDTHVGYAGIPAILLHNGPLTKLTLAQTRALSGYVHHGGVLIVSAGDQGRSVLGTFVGDLLPGASSRVVTVPSLSQLGRRFRAALPADKPVLCGLLSGPGVEPMFWQGSVAVVSTCPVLRGRVIWVGFDVARPPFRGWPGAGGFWQYLTSMPSRAEPDTHEVSRSIQRLTPDPTPLTWVFLFFALYLACLGPGLFWALRRLKAPLAIWLAAPALALVFAVLTPLLSVGLRNASSNLFTTALVEQFPHSAIARLHVVAAVFSRGRDQHTLAIPAADGAAALMPTGRAARLSAPEVARARSPREGIVIDPLRVGAWSSLAVEVEATVPNVLRAQARLVEREPGSWRLTVRNRGSAAIPDGHVLIAPARDKRSPGRWTGAAVAAIGFGGDRQVDFDERQSLSMPRFAWPWLQRSLSERTPEGWLDGHAAWVIGDSLGALASKRQLDRASQRPRSALADLPWPDMVCDRMLEHQLDCRALVYWLPIERKPRLVSSLPYGAIEPRIHSEIVKAGRSSRPWRVCEFALPPDEPAEELSVRVRYEVLPDKYELQVYRCSTQSWADVRWAKKDKVLRKGDTRRRSHSVSAREAVLPSPQDYIDASNGIVALRENLPPNRQGRWVQRARITFGHRVEIAVKFSKPVRAALPGP